MEDDQESSPRSPPPTFSPSSGSDQKQELQIAAEEDEYIEVPLSELRQVGSSCRTHLSEVKNHCRSGNLSQTRKIFLKDTNSI